MDLREQLALERRLERCEEALMSAGFLPRPTVLEKVQPERVSCEIVAESSVVGVQWGGQNTKAKYTPCVIRVRHCDRDMDYSINAFDGFGDYKIIAACCRKSLVTEIRWSVKK